MLKSTALPRSPTFISQSLIIILEPSCSIMRKRRRHIPYVCQDTALSINISFILFDEFDQPGPEQGK
jgi:hypothetical protein